MTAKQEAERSDFYAVKDLAEGCCECNVGVRATKSELTFEQFKRVVCVPCQARASLAWMLELSQEG